MKATSLSLNPREFTLISPKGKITNPRPGDRIRFVVHEFAVCLLRRIPHPEKDDLYSQLKWRDPEGAICDLFELIDPTLVEFNIITAEQAFKYFLLFRDQLCEKHGLRVPQEETPSMSSDLYEYALERIAV